MTRQVLCAPMTRSSRFTRHSTADSSLERFVPCSYRVRTVFVPRSYRGRTVFVPCSYRVRVPCSCTVFTVRTVFYLLSLWCRCLVVGCFFFMPTCFRNIQNRITIDSENAKIGLFPRKEGQHLKCFLCIFEILLKLSRNFNSSENISFDENSPLGPDCITEPSNYDLKSLWFHDIWRNQLELILYWMYNTCGI